MWRDLYITFIVWPLRHNSNLCFFGHILPQCPCQLPKSYLSHKTNLCSPDWFSITQKTRVIVRVPEKKKSGRKARESRVSAGTLYFYGQRHGWIAAIVYSAIPAIKRKLRWHIDRFLNDKQAGVKKISLYL